MKPSTSCKGFTLIELLVVIAIIGLLAALLPPAPPFPASSRHSRPGFAEKFPSPFTIDGRPGETGPTGYRPRLAQR